MGRAPCCEKSGLKKGPWTLEEDQKLIDYIQKNGYGNWRTLPKNAGLQRCGKSCRLRWTNYLRPDIKRGKFSSDEEDTIIQLHSILGNKWSAIAARLPGRTDNEIKNYWNTHIRKRLLRMGIDPVTHSPRIDLSAILNPSIYANPINFSRLISGVNSPINPHLLRLATSLLSANPQNHLMQPNNPQFSPFLPLQDASIPTVTSQDQAQFMQYDSVERLGHNLQFDFASQNCQLNDWNRNDDSVYSGVTEDYAAVTNYGSDQSVADPAQSSEASTFQSNSSSYNAGFQSLVSNISTPSSSPTTLHSGSTEMENYCNNMLNFHDIPADMFGVADFI